MNIRNRFLSFVLLGATAPLFGQIYYGNLDSANCTSIVGYAADSTQPNTSLNVDLYAGTTPVATVLANVYRGDIGIGNGLHGFDVPPESVQHRNRI